MTSDGSPYARFRRAIERGNLLVAEARTRAETTTPFFDDDPILAEQVERWDLQKDDRSTGRSRPQRRRGLFARLLRRRR